MKSLRKLKKGEIKFLTPYGYNRIKIRKNDPYKLKVNSFQEWFGYSYDFILRSANSEIFELLREDLWSIVNEQGLLLKRARIQLHNLVSGLSTENLEMKSKIARVELENTEMKKEMRGLSLNVKSLINN